ncbi:hypothetical protein [Larkinella harenae]
MAAMVEYIYQDDVIDSQDSMYHEKTVLSIIFRPARAGSMIRTA